MLIYDRDSTKLVSTTNKRNVTRLHFLINNEPRAPMCLEIRKDGAVYIVATDLEFRVEQPPVKSEREFLQVKDYNHGSAAIAAVATYLLNKATYGTVPLPELLPLKISNTQLTFLVNRTVNKKLKLYFDHRGDIEAIVGFGLCLPQPINCQGKSLAEVVQWFLTSDNPQIEFFKWRATFDHHFLHPFPPETI